MTTDGDGIPVQQRRRSRLADLDDLSGPPPEWARAATSLEAEQNQLHTARREFAVLLGEFRRTAVLVPLDEAGDLWSAEQNGVRWICALSDEAAREAEWPVELSPAELSSRASVQVPSAVAGRSSPRWASTSPRKIGNGDIDPLLEYDVPKLTPEQIAHFVEEAHRRA
ncbi:hypothetical protein [Streptomyces sp. NBC_01185]|uniref:hypothetical protein n=1 Tax=Streptomyces sp. NBC_01185 TaxID=2903764 RepID=UPI0038676FCC|nr:hypothetical protein OG770_31590 [Streptomyces sp. NBC_01185]